jgi:Sec-independent protein translocase protein TatA
MDSFFGIGLAELIVILVLAGLVMGPQHIRRVARTLGRITAQLQNISREFTRQLNAELDSLDTEDVKGAVQDVKELQRQVQELRRELAAMPRALAGESRQALRGIDAGQPPEGDNPPSAPPANGREAPPLPKPLDVSDDSE